MPPENRHAGAWNNVVIVLGRLLQFEHTNIQTVWPDETPNVFRPKWWVFPDLRSHKALAS